MFMYTHYFQNISILLGALNARVYLNQQKCSCHLYIILGTDFQNLDFVLDPFVSLHLSSLKMQKWENW